ncbi:MAG: hypothetical protein KJ915_05625 [Candidatus Omnitrophica bacterium]|nr:hypothetical protein [Candidatus Omnitrophota bacterium]
MEATWMDYIGITCILIANILFYIRKMILSKYGFELDIIDSKLIDFKRFKDIIATKVQGEKKKKYTLINNSIKVFFFLGVLILFMVHFIK